MKDFGTRASDIFRQARDRVSDECKNMHANHAARGLLRSGATARRAVSIFQEQMSEALDQALGEAAKIIEHRGREWSSAMDAIRAALDNELATAPSVLEPSLKLAGIGSGGTGAAVQVLMDRAGQALREKLDEFADGWTAPQPKRWSERHPGAYALVLLVAGSIIGAIVTQFWPEWSF